jgi:hypothetical protein
VPGTGLELPPRLNFQTWLGIGQQLSALASSSAWCLGDWLNYGQAAYAGRYRNAIEQTSLDYQTLRNYAWVARRFTLSRRRDTVSFGHHAEVASLPGPEQDFWLRKAEELGWSCRQLRSEVRASLRERGVGAAITEASTPDGESQRADDQHSLLITITHDQFESCQQAAAREHLTIQAWATRALSRAAHQSTQGSLKPGHSASAAGGAS